ncbi:hypothetical protein SUGI_1122630 [Cryptomeria japonica]|uniref:pectinesterase-like n=1 Tax=Cryptomeria japonica TaxID=3369 RepID=UPI00241498C4|nr:pectinesterase-like [Cryptomeria japonica]GLJ52727.1 hypothetical protein SUGI_1122630 [Cryptomeria japonica]
MATKLLSFVVVLLVSISQTESDSTANLVESACELAVDRKYCQSVLYKNPQSLLAGPQNITQIAFQMSIGETQMVSSFILTQLMNADQSQAVDDCRKLNDLTMDYLTKALSILTESYLDWIKATDIQSYLSAALTNQVTCLDGLTEANLNLCLVSFTDYISRASQSVSNCLALINKFWIEEMDFQQSSVRNRRLLSHAHHVGRVDHDLLPFDGGFPSWMSRGDRRLLMQTAKGVKLTGNVVTVAKDGSGDYTNITAAINAAADMSENRLVIYVTAGVYKECVNVPLNKDNIMLIGDGIDATVITGSKSVSDGWTTFSSATLATFGKGFIARDLTIENRAGPGKQQAVALLVASDLSAFYRCSIKGYQDTLYAHSLRQFYRECNVYGTIDFIFGNAAVIFQQCNLVARRPLDHQQNVYIAQGRTDPNQNTGTSIHNCKVIAATDLVPFIDSIPTYLGRPWKEYSRTVYLESYIGSLIQPVGWLEWSGSFALSTLYYGEYNNQGPGADTSQRVTWPGYHLMKLSDAQKFTITSFLSGSSWLPTTSVPYWGSLLSK